MSERERLQMQDLADRLMAYWRERGYVVRAWVETETGTDGWTVRSDLKNGRPMRRIGE